jgi:hypothetical protein
MGWANILMRDGVWNEKGWNGNVERVKLRLEEERENPRLQPSYYLLLAVILLGSLASGFPGGRKAVDGPRVVHTLPCN